MRGCYAEQVSVENEGDMVRDPDQSKGIQQTEMAKSKHLRSSPERAG